MEEMHRRRILEWELEQAEAQRWWDSLTPAEKEAIEKKQEREREETRKHEAEERRKAEEQAAAHRASVAEYESRHGGATFLRDRALAIEKRLSENPAPTYSVSVGGVLLVAMVFALVPGLLFNGVFHSSGGGILLAEAMAVSGWGVWLMLRRERAHLRATLVTEEEDVARQRGCGNLACSQCYPNEHFRKRWETARRQQGGSAGCAVSGCPTCYPTGENA
jgi:hypothetical protein